MIYIDGESHYVRSEQWVKAVMGEKFTLAQYVDLLLKTITEFNRTHVGFPWDILVEPKCKFFWDSRSLADVSGRGWKPSNKVYFTSFSGDEEALHSARVFIRCKGFDPQVEKERVVLADRRTGTLGNEGLIEKAKGVDIALAVRMLEDAQRNVFSECALYTSDVDYLPVIRAVQRMGKLVHVLGYRSGLGKHSPLEYVPHTFIDLEQSMRGTKEFVHL